VDTITRNTEQNWGSLGVLMNESLPEFTEQGEPIPEHLRAGYNYLMKYLDGANLDGQSASDSVTTLLVEMGLLEGKFLRPTDEESLP
jgi:hypothetical protein